MSLFTPCVLYCPVCRREFDWHKGYGREIRCCGKECHDEVAWQRTLSIMGEDYYPLAEKPAQEDESR